MPNPLNPFNPLFRRMPNPLNPLNPLFRGLPNPFNSFNSLSCRLPNPFNSFNSFNSLLRKYSQLLLLCLLLLLPLSAVAQEGRCPVVKMQVERLPDLSIPRASHQLFCAGGEYVVAGGHTDGFVPTPTAEYFKDDEWHTMPMVYSHDFACSVELQSGKVLLLGGCKEPLGIGQTHTAELYDPEAHTFRGFGCLDQKRAAASATQLPDGRVVIAGNWYHDDSIELFDGLTTFTHVKAASIPRSAPYIFPTAPDDAIIFGAFDTKGDSLHSSIADRLKGPPTDIPLFRRWHPFGCSIHQNAPSFIGDMAHSRYHYLVPVCDSTGQVAIAQIKNGVATLLPTACPVPTAAQWGAIEYFSAIIADRQRARAYLVGANADFRSHPQDGARLYVLRIDYDKASQLGTPAPLTLYYTDPLPVYPDYSPVLTPDGRLLLAGGLQSALSNFSPSASAYLLSVGVGGEASSDRCGVLGVGGKVWLAVLAAMLVVVCAGIAVFRRRRSATPDTSNPTLDNSNSTSDTSADLMQRIDQLMQQDRLYLNSQLKVGDIAKLLHLHRNAISACINSQTGYTFTQYVNHYRIDHAKQMMREKPHKKISTIWMESGFGSEQTFFKTFRTITGLSPKEWISQIND